MRRLRSTPANAQEERLFDLLYARAFAPLEPEQQRELDSLVAQSPDVDTDCYDRAAAAIDLHCRAGRVAPMPEHVKASILARAPAIVRARPKAPANAPVAERTSDTARTTSSATRSTNATTSATTRAPSSIAAWSGWIVAAAATVVAVLGWMRTPEAPPTPVVATPRTLSPAEQRAELLATAKDIVTLDWKPTEDPHGKSVSGDIVWSPSRQLGFMRFRGLPRNTADRSQYQLWIFDKPRGTDHPVDGGVFDVASVDGEWVVPIDAKLQVFEPALFAVTEEAAGGVVVSKREHIVALAQL